MEVNIADNHIETDIKLGKNMIEIGYLGLKENISDKDMIVIKNF